MTRFCTIPREKGIKLLIDLETLKEYPLTIETLIGMMNLMNEEILELEEYLIKYWEHCDDERKLQDGLVLGDAYVSRMTAITDVMETESNIHKKTNKEMNKLFGAFDNDGNYKGVIE